MFPGLRVVCVSQFLLECEVILFFWIAHWCREVVVVVLRDGWSVGGQLNWEILKALVAFAIYTS